MEEGADYRPGPSAQPGVDTLRIPSACAGLRLDVALAQLFPAHSRARLQGWIKAGRLLLDDRVCEVRRKVMGGETVRWANPPVDAEAPGEGDPEGLDDLAEPPPAAIWRAEAIPLNIVFEDAHILVIDKPAGLVVHPGNGNPRGTVLNALLHHDPALAGVPRAGIVHRLDKDTSGLMVVARTLLAQTDLVRQLQARSVSRKYLALALGRVELAGTVNAPVGRHPVQRTRMAVLRSGGREARTHYRVLEHFARCTLLECTLDTGRTHQIRVHMAHLGHPLAGDPVYGKTRSGDVRLDAFARQALHARALALVHPHSGEAMAWEAPLPEDFAQLLAALRDG